MITKSASASSSFINCLIFLPLKTVDVSWIGVEPASTLTLVFLYCCTASSMLTSPFITSRVPNSCSFIPSTLAVDGFLKSASTRITLYPFIASDIAMLAETVDFPSPGIALVTRKDFMPVSFCARSILRRTVLAASRKLLGILGLSSTINSCVCVRFLWNLA